MQLHEWDENLKDESLPSNPIGIVISNFFILFACHLMFSLFFIS